MINTREIAGEYRLTHWARIMQERVQSGMSIKAFCKHIGICGNTYFYWQRRVRAAAAEIAQENGMLPLTTTGTREVTPAAGQAQTALMPVERKAALPTPTPSVPSGWAQVQAEEEPKSIVSAALPVEIGKCRIMVSEDTDLALLEKVCRTLGPLC